MARQQSRHQQHQQQEQERLEEAVISAGKPGAEDILMSRAQTATTTATTTIPFPAMDDRRLDQSASGRGGMCEGDFGDEDGSGGDQSQGWSSLLFTGAWSAVDVREHELLRGHPEAHIDGYATSHDLRTV
jgi:hypothetical protein